MSSALTNIESKHDALKERRNADRAMQMEIDKLVKLYVDGEDPPPTGCGPKLASCLPGFGVFRKKRIAVATSEACESAAVATSTTSDVMSRFVGRAKGARAGEQSSPMEQATRTVSERVEQLTDRLKLARAMAVKSSKAGRKEEALREMKRVKALEKQLATASTALEALERQSDALAQTALQKELATALASANSQMKSKSKGLLSLTEKAVDESAERLDEAEDISQVLEGMAPAGAGMDEDELLEELSALVEDEADAGPVGSDTDEQPRSPQQQSQQHLPVASGGGGADWSDFPSAPARSPSRPTRSEDRQSLLSHHG